MRHSAVRTGLSILALSVFSAAAPAAEWSQVTKILNVTTVEGMKVLRLEISPNVTANPAGCDAIAFIDVQLDADSNSSETQRLLLNAVQLAFLTGRNIKFFVREDRCSTAATPSRLRVTTGVQVSN